MEKPKVIIQIDCDSEIALSEHYGVNSCQYGTEVYYNVLDVFYSQLRQYNLKAIFFIVGKDLENDKKCEKVKRLLLSGHEIANHTYCHHNNLSKLTTTKAKKEIEKTNQNAYFPIYFSIKK